eukprot:1884835-Pyramimonas_sp.AAC.1
MGPHSWLLNWTPTRAILASSVRSIRKNDADDEIGEIDPGNDAEECDDCETESDKESDWPWSEPSDEATIGRIMDEKALPTSEESESHSADKSDSAESDSDSASDTPTERLEGYKLSRRQQSYLTPEALAGYRKTSP